ncbi:MAG TPA: hypothetical protein VJX10_09075, partial [Pseudonocardiaceae bacterium]|nr:hypothetical protein [Pseudonocardiaceae bacterium]
GEHMRSAYATYLACTPASSASCEFAWQNFRDSYGQPGLVGVVLLFLPGIVGVFAGAPVLARELETGTFRYAWTQGVGRIRWAVAALVPGAIGAAVVMGAFGVLVGWHNLPLVQAGIRPRLRATDFPATGLAAAGWALAGFALGVLAGLLCRRIVPALATALAAWFGLAFLTADVLRPNYLAPVTTTSLQLSGRDLPLGQWWTKGGVRVSDAQINTVLQAIGFRDTGSAKPTVQAGGGAVDPVRYLIQHGYAQVTSYQPDSRFWTFQWMEFGWLTVLALLLLGAAFWLLRRRPA